MKKYWKASSSCAYSIDICTVNNIRQTYILSLSLQSFLSLSRFLHNTWYFLSFSFIPYFSHFHSMLSFSLCSNEIYVNLLSMKHNMDGGNRKKRKFISLFPHSYIYWFHELSSETILFIHAINSSAVCFKSFSYIILIKFW